INRNAAGSAKALACTDSVKDGVDLVLDRRPTIVAGETTGSAYVVSMKLSSPTSNSSSASGLASATQKDGKWCVSLFWFRQSAPRRDAHNTGRWCRHRHHRQCPITTTRLPPRSHRRSLPPPAPDLSPKD